MAPSWALLGVPSRSSSRCVDEPLLGRLEADQLRADLVEHRVDGLADPLAAVALAAVAQLDRLEGAGGGTRGHRRAADGAVVEGDLDLDGGVAARVEDLARADCLDGRHDVLLQVEGKGTYTSPPSLTARPPATAARLALRRRLADCAA